MHKTQKNSQKNAQNNASLRHHNFVLTDGEKQELRKAFNLFDKNGGGTIARDEVRVALRVLGFNPTLDELHSLMEMIEARDPKMDKSEGINFNEFTQIILEKINEPQQQQQLMRSFNNLDIDCDGTISLSDLTAVAEELGEDLSPDELGEMIMTICGNADKFDIHTQDVGAITPHQFISAINKSLDN